MKQFDAPKKKKTGELGENEDDENEDGADLVDALDALEDELEDESNSEGEEEDSRDENGEDEFDLRRGMSSTAIKVLEESVKPVREVLTKVTATSPSYTSILIQEQPSPSFERQPTP